jgi:hypothetical protein
MAVIYLLSGGDPRALGGGQETRDRDAAPSGDTRREAR